MAIEKRIETNPDGSMSFILEDTDGSGDLDRLMGELCQKHKETAKNEQKSPIDTMVEHYKHYVS